MNGPNEKPDAQWWAQLNAHLAKSGFSQQQRKAAIGQTPKERTRGEIADDLSIWLGDNA